MGDKAWKAFERRVARVFGGRRRGAYVRGAEGGLSDIIAPGWSVECKLLGRPGYADMLDACHQAELAAKPDERPVAVVKKKHGEDVDALVVMRLEVFRAWFVGRGAS